MKNYTKTNVGSEGRVELHEKLALTGAEISVNKLPAGACVPFVHSHKNIYTKGAAQELQMSFWAAPIFCHSKNQPPRYAFLISSLSASSSPVPERTTLPDSRTYALSAILSAFSAFCSTRSIVVPCV